MNKSNLNKKKLLFFIIVYTVGAISFSSFDSCVSGEAKKVGFVAPKKGDTSPAGDNPLVNRLTEDVNFLKNQIKDQNQVIADLKSKVGDNTIQGLAKDIDSIINLQKPDSLINETKNNTTAITSMQDDKVPGSLANLIDINVKNIDKNTKHITEMQDDKKPGSLANLIDINANNIAKHTKDIFEMKKNNQVPGFLANLIGINANIAQHTKDIVEMKNNQKQGSLAESIANIKIILKAILVNAGPNGGNIAFVNKYEVPQGGFQNGAAAVAPAPVLGNQWDINLILDTINKL